MRHSSTLAFIIAAQFPLFCSAQAVVPSEVTPVIVKPIVVKPVVSDWKAGLAALHGKVKDQGDVGFCWANSWTSFLESKVLIEKNKVIELSSFYVGRAGLADGLVDTLKQMDHGEINNSDSNLRILTRYQKIKNDPLALEVTKEYFTRKLKTYSSRNLEGGMIKYAFRFGVVPVSIYERTSSFPSALRSMPGDFPPHENRYFSPEYESIFEDFISKKLFHTESMNTYLSRAGKYQLQRDIDTEIGNQAISEADSFIFEGELYTPRSFLRDYIGFDPTGFRMKPIQLTSLLSHAPTIPMAVNTPEDKLKSGVAWANNFDEVVNDIQSELDQRRPVLLSMLLLDDLDHNDNFFLNGVFDPSYCEKPGDCKSAGGHAVMIVNSMKDKDGKIKAFIIQNSWGPKGVDENGKFTNLRAERGFNIVTLDYLRAAIKIRDFAFSYIMI